MTKSEKVSIALPGGELERDMIRFLTDVGFDLTAVNQRYLH